MCMVQLKRKQVANQEMKQGVGCQQHHNSIIFFKKALINLKPNIEYRCIVFKIN
jgi:hypothetical protein